MDGVFPCSFSSSCAPVLACAWQGGCSCAKCPLLLRRWTEKQKQFLMWSSLLKSSLLSPNALTLWEPAALSGYPQIRSVPCALCCAGTDGAALFLVCFCCCAGEGLLESPAWYLHSCCWGARSQQGLFRKEAFSTRRHPTWMWGGCFCWRAKWDLGFMLGCLPEAMVFWAWEGLSRSILRSLFIPEREVYVLCAY